MSKLIPLTQGKSALVDDEDYERLSTHKWHAVRSGKKWYAARQGIYMHHALMGLPPAGMVVDHINGDGLDNQKANRRFATFSQNASNSTRANGRLYRGVFAIQKNKYMVRIAHDSTQFYGGVFGYIHQAACAANALMARLHGEHARLNNVEAAND